MADDLFAIILAAGKGARIRSARAKILHRVGGFFLIHYALQAINKVNQDKVPLAGGGKIYLCRLDGEARG
jgi:bifunctional UDP-N-acetylglucosamine pyrophosphorylase/glucosamine-1-phosphate N-acetyltransferase